MEKDTNLIKLGKRIRSLREERGFSQEAFAVECELDRSYMGGIERGTRNITVQTLVQIAKGLGVEIGELFPPIKQLSTKKAKPVKSSASASKGA